MSVRRRQIEVADIVTVDAVEVHSVIARARICGSLWDFLRAQGLQGRVVENAIGGADPQHDIQVQKTIPFNEFNNLVNEWKESYINS